MQPSQTHHRPFPIHTSPISHLPLVSSRASATGATRTGIKHMHSATIMGCVCNPCPFALTHICQEDLLQLLGLLPGLLGPGVSQHVEVKAEGAHLEAQLLTGKDPAARHNKRTGTLQTGCQEWCAHPVASQKGMHLNCRHSCARCWVDRQVAGRCAHRVENQGRPPALQAQLFKMLAREHLSEQSAAQCSHSPDVHVRRICTSSRSVWWLASNGGSAGRRQFEFGRQWLRGRLTACRVWWLAGERPAA